MSGQSEGVPVGNRGLAAALHRVGSRVATLRLRRSSINCAAIVSISFNVFY